LALPPRPRIAGDEEGCKKHTWCSVYLGHCSERTEPLGKPGPGLPLDLKDDPAALYDPARWSAGSGNATQTYHDINRPNPNDADRVGRLGLSDCLSSSSLTKDAP